MADSYGQRMIDHFRGGNATEEDWRLLGQVFFVTTMLTSLEKEELSVTAQVAIADLDQLMEFNKRVNFPEKLEKTDVCR